MMEIKKPLCIFYAFVSRNNVIATENNFLCKLNCFHIDVPTDYFVYFRQFTILWILGSYDQKKDQKKYQTIDGVNVLINMDQLVSDD